MILFSLGLEAWRENLSMDWQKYQHKYKDELLYRAQTEQDRAMAREYEIKMRQIVIPEIKSFDRCVTCHVAIEDNRMKDMPNPLKSHPGDYLDTHDMNKVGCTSCHDGQGRAITFEDAHAKGVEKFWEKPILKKTFIESTCVRCHADSLKQIPTYNLGKQLFQQKACFACHSIGDIGGVKGPALSDIGRASFHTKMPIPENRARLLDKFDQNVNLAYLYEAITQPDAQPKDTLMKIAPLSEEEVLSLMVYLKSLSSERRVMDIGVSKSQTVGAVANMAVTVQAATTSSQAVTGGSSKGYLVFSRACITCHTVGGGDRVGPDLQGVTSRHDKEWLKSFIQNPSKKIEAKDPSVMELLAKYKTPMVDMGLTEEEVEDVIRYLKNPKDISVAAASPQSAGLSGKAKDIPKTAANQGAISKGAALFQGKQRFLNRGAACMSCHNVRNGAAWGGGEMAKDLTDAHSRLGSVAIPTILKNPPFPVMQAVYKDKPLTEDEITALTSFLENVANQQGNQIGKNDKAKMSATGILGLFGLLLFYGVFWMTRKRQSVNKGIYDRQKKSKKEF